MLQLKISGGQRVISKYKGFDGKRILRQSQLRGANYGRIVLTTYPPERPGQKYVRQFILQRGWRVITTPTGYMLTNNEARVKWVQDQKFQARIHRGRWRPAQLILREAEDVALAEAHVELKDFINS